MSLNFSRLYYLRHALIKSKAVSSASHPLRNTVCPSCVRAKLHRRTISLPIFQEPEGRLIFEESRTPPAPVPLQRFSGTPSQKKKSKIFSGINFFSEGYIYRAPTAATPPLHPPRPLCGKEQNRSFSPCSRCAIIPMFQKGRGAILGGKAPLPFLLCSLVRHALNLGSGNLPEPSSAYPFQATVLYPTCY